MTSCFKALLSMCLLIVFFDGRGMDGRSDEEVRQKLSSFFLYSSALPSSLTMKAEPDSCRYEVPNVFSPNGDGKNDLFRVRSEHCGVKNMRIYNRWGQLLYQQENEEPAWDGRTAAGKEVPEGTYLFSVRIGDETVQGSLTLMR